MHLPLPLPYLLALLAALAGVAAFLYSRRRQELRVAAINVYPLKSGRGVPVQSAVYGRLGFRFDRQWVVVRADTGLMVSARDAGHMVLIQPRVDEAVGTLTLAYAGMKDLVVPIAPPNTAQSVEVWETRMQARRYGDEACQWISDVINSKPALPHAQYVLATIISEEAHDRPVDAKYDWNTGALKQKQQAAGSEVHTGAFADGFPFLVTTETSLAALNKWTAGSRVVEMASFRPNIVLSGGLAWEEDEWRLLQIGEDPTNRFWAAKPCERCIFTTVVPSTGVRHPTGEPLISLREHRKMAKDLPKFAESVFFGQNILQQKPAGLISVGDRVTVIDRKSTKLEFAKPFLDSQDPQSQESITRRQVYGI